MTTAGPEFLRTLAAALDGPHDHPDVPPGTPDRLWAVAAELTRLRAAQQIDEDALRRAGFELIDPNAFGERIWKPPVNRQAGRAIRAERENAELRAVLDDVRAAAADVYEAFDELDRLVVVGPTLAGLLLQCAQALDVFRAAISDSPEEAR